jgi:hypothetical protein
MDQGDSASSAVSFQPRLVGKAVAGPRVATGAESGSVASPKTLQRSTRSNQSQDRMAHPPSGARATAYTPWEKCQASPAHNSLTERKRRSATEAGYGTSYASTGWDGRGVGPPEDGLIFGRSLSPLCLSGRLRMRALCLRSMTIAILVVSVQPPCGAGTSDGAAVPWSAGSPVALAIPTPAPIAGTRRFASSTATWARNSAVRRRGRYCRRGAPPGGPILAAGRGRARVSVQVPW